MPYDYYARLKPRQQATYRRSDEIVAIDLPDAGALAPLVAALVAALTTERRASIEAAARMLAAAVLAALEVPGVRVKVLSRRPSTSSSELHGLYEPREGRSLPLITVWMRTAHHKRVVAFRTFLRTLLHELCHHLDYELLGLDDSFHTAGFFKRESSLYKQLAVTPSARVPSAAS